MRRGHNSIGENATFVNIPYYWVNTKKKWEDGRGISWSKFSWSNPIGFKESIEYFMEWCYIKHTESTHSKVDAPEKRFIYLSMRGAHLVCRRGGHYFFLLLFLSRSRKARNAITIDIIKNIWTEKPFLLLKMQYNTTQRIDKKVDW